MYKYQYYTTHIVDNGDSERELKEIMLQGDKSLSLNDELSFDWTQAYIFDPYTPNKTVKETVNNNWIAPKTTFISYLFGRESDFLIQDTEKRIVIVNDYKVLKDIIYNKSEFDILDKHLKQNDVLELEGNNQYKIK